MPLRTSFWLIIVFMAIPAPMVAFAAPANSVFTTEMKAGDNAYRTFNNESAWSHYTRAVALDSTNCTALWKLSRACVDRSATAPKKEKPALLADGERLARRAVALCPDSAVCHLRLAMVLGRTAENAGAKQKIALSREVKHEAQAALDLDPASAGALHILGRWNYAIASLNWLEKSMANVIYGGVPPGASMKAAKDYFEKAIDVDPGAPLNHFWLGETLIKLDDYADARRELQECLDCKDVFWDDRFAKDRARKQLKDIEDKK